MKTSWTMTYVEAPKTITYSLGDFLNSIERNGLPQITGDYWKGYSGNSIPVGKVNTYLEVTAACAIGQSALNLEVDYRTLVSIVNKKFKTAGKRGLATSIIGRNDGHRWSYKRIAEYYRGKFANRLDETFEIPRAISVRKDN